MGWSLKKAFNFGTLRINLSKKGIGYSVGVRGFRVGHDAKGQQYSQTSIPGTGLYKRSYLGQFAGSRNWSILAFVAAFLHRILTEIASRPN